jgi:polysaccharide biosynthesis protein PslH
MKILMVSSFLPYPLLNGGNIRLYSLLKYLSKIHEITLVCEKRDYQKESDIQEVGKVCKKVITVPRKKQWSVENVLKTAFSPDPFLIVGHTSREMKHLINEELEKNQYDLIHVETSYVFQNLPKVSIPIILVEHNVEYLVYKRFADQAPFFLKPLLSLDVLKLKFKEQSFWKKATKLVAVSQAEKDIMNAYVVVPNGADIERFKLKDLDYTLRSGQRLILFIGDFRWIQNRDAIEWIIKDIWPEIKVKNQEVKLWVVGRRIPDRIKKLTSDESIIFDEDAPTDTYDIYEKAFILLSPIRVGGGSSFKILEAMSCGLPVLTTNLGAGGIGAKDRINTLIAENSKGFADNVTELLRNEKFYKELALNARSFVVENYSWDGIAKKLNALYKSLE